MSKCTPAILALISASFAFGQLDSNSVTVTSSSNTTPQPDQVVFSVVVSSPSSTGLTDIFAALQGSGITIANFSNVSTVVVSGIVGGILPSPYPPPGPVVSSPLLSWAFSLVVPVTNVKTTITMLTALQQSVSQKSGALTLSFSVQGTQVSLQAQQSQPCAIPDLLADARAQAQTLAAAGGRILSGIVGLSSVTSNTGGICTVTVKFALLGS